MEVFIVAGNPKAKEFLLPLLQQMGETPTITSAFSSSEARRFLIDNEYDLVLISAPLPDEFGAELAGHISNTTSAGILLLVKNELADSVSEKMEPYGVCVVAMPTTRALFHQSLRMTLAARSRMLGLRSENERLQNKIEEIRLVDRAKCMLIQYQDMTEPQAHRYIEKSAMDRRLTRREIAERILRSYEPGNETNL